MPKAYLIDVAAKQVTEVEQNGLEDLQRLVGGDRGKVYVEPVPLSELPGHVLLVDEDARVRTPNLPTFGVVGAFTRVDGLLGNGLLVKWGEHFAAPEIGIDAFRSKVIWGNA